MDEAQKSINQFQTLQQETFALRKEREALMKANKFMEQKLTDLSSKYGTLEQQKKKESADLKDTRDQLNVIQGEYEFYKGLADKLEFRQTDELGALSKQLRIMSEREKDYKMNLELMEKEKEECEHRNLQLITDIQRMQRDLKSILAVNEEYQQQAQNFKERENQLSDLAREYREKVEAVKFEREKIAFKEEQFLR
mmetsp:Transcript_5561/g.8747  ORF Transcript_5561/g.8747 Transcript_5561/m.8747 type:complete len:196 (+) Transcript_5561:880-1467(+)|eukprot:CAMPEP_0170480314 /NCGR_PEP_ID=MMETSP0208-20121228/1202_1 /TAXON_ID=197538 /ORGANISM="Strombidium inclinatum, Strain S3" /LENGTH=195 /DNA_ID=CAMNT_0010752843 /DNA_START=851 /DNA_END=1438 /DNA_ORIENTATION=+